jgi:hypothetical protein
MKEKPAKNRIHLQILEALKNRQNVELRGKSIAVRKLLDELAVTEREKGRFRYNKRCDLPSC